MSDKEIIQLLRQNKYSAALKGLYSILPDTQKYIKANSGSPDDAEDILQDALVVLYKKVQDEKFSTATPLKYYLLAIVKNCWMQELRRRKKITLSYPALQMDMAIEETYEELSFVFAKAAFELLGENCKRLLILFYFKKESYINIASILAFSDDKVAKNQKYRCLQKAKDYYLQLSKKNGHE
ncbi:MAG: sigma-70 family RNA polymerase sigma factor [Ferruginibacter sp.]